MTREMFLDGKKVGEGCPCYVIAEIGSNHNRDLDTARRLIELAKECGCDAVKFQSYCADTLYSRDTPPISEMQGRSYPGETPYELIKRIEMPMEWHPILKKFCDKVGITFCSTPFDENMVNVLEGVSVPYYKIASYEITHYPLLKKIASLGKPVILSTGSSHEEEVAHGIGVLEQNGCREYALLHCVSQYPARYGDMNLRCISGLKKKFHCPVGLSDHTMDHLSTIAAIALGACILEKHITLSRKSFGPDHPFALEPMDLKEWVATVRRTESALGDGVKAVRKSEEENRLLARRSLIAAVDLKAGDVLTEEKIVIKRPALGIQPALISRAIGKRLVKDVQQDHWITWDDLVG